MPFHKPLGGLAVAALLSLSGFHSMGPAFGQDARRASSEAGTASLPGPSDEQLAKLEGIYEDIHANPELSMQEKRTAGIAAKWLRDQDFEVTEGVGGTGVVGILRNGDGPTVLLRADMDALPMKENTGFPTPARRRGPIPHPAGRRPSRIPAGTTCM